VPASAYGRAYGFERTMDNLGAIIDPLLALGLMVLVDVRAAMLISIVPGVLAAASIVYAIRHTPRPEVNSLGVGGVGLGLGLNGCEVSTDVRLFRSWATAVVDAELPSTDRSRLGTPTRLPSRRSAAQSALPPRCPYRPTDRPIAVQADRPDEEETPDHADEGSSVEGAFVAADRRLTGWRP
jgi:hypothetical protein